jgi:myo-inositol-1(or 4)-monophosphatase
MALPSDYAARLEFCISTAQRAGEIVKAARLNGFEQRYKDGIELVSSTDEASDRFIREEIRRHYPDDGILSEEGDSAASPSVLTDPVWVVDPIDGTVNFVHGQDCVAIAIAYSEDGIVRLGAVHAPFRGETFSAILGHGAFRNGEPIRVSNTIRLRDALIGTGFPHDRSHLTALMPNLFKVLINCQDVRRLGSPALDICFVADGRLDGFYEGYLHPWDIAAAALIAREAGGTWGNLGPVPSDTPSDLYGRDVVVTTPAIFDLLSSLLREDKSA